jgi:predicted N-formylglutamate amidohydrolase
VLVSFDALLREDDPPVFLIERAKGASAFLLTCDHAGREIPHKLANLSLSEQQFWVSEKVEETKGIRLGSYCA